MSTAVIESRSARPGGENVLARLSELMFVEAIRRHLETLPPAETGWLARRARSARRPRAGRAARRPAAPWTVERLARASRFPVRCSRSASR